MAKFFAELKRRNMYRVAAAYAVVAWLLLQVVNNVAPVMDLPPWVARAFLLLLVIGFPITLLFEWMHELPPADNSVPQATTRLDYVLAGALIVVIALVSYQQLAPRGVTSAREQSGIEAAKAVAASARTGISLAVLCFTNLSGDPEQEFFSDGITEEITTALAKVPDLTVVGRTSACQFKGQSRDLRAIGQALNATHLIEGSVRKAGDRLRITAQLIDASNGTHLWSENYDRLLTDIFAIQEDIATAITGALRVPLGLQQGERLVSNRTSDLDSYQAYLRARALFRARNTDMAIAALEKVVARDPTYAPAWGLLAHAYAYGPTFGSQNLTMVRARGTETARHFVQSEFSKAEMAAREAIRLDPRQPGGYAAFAFVQARRGNVAAAEDLHRQAFALDPNDPDGLESYSETLASAGRLKQAMALREQLRTLEPFVPAYNGTTALIMELNRRTTEAIATLEAMPRDTATEFARNMALARLLAAAGRYSEAADTLLAIEQNPNLDSQEIRDAALLLRNAQAKASTPAELPPLNALNFVYAFVGAENRILDEPERLTEIGYVNGYAFRVLWAPIYASLRKTERFKALMRGAGIVEYWRARGWPDLCRPVGADDFVCE